MATARAAAARSRAAREEPPARAGPRGPSGVRAQGIRWDRVARTMLLVVLLAVLVSFLGPATKYVRTWQLARETRAEVSELRDDNARLRQKAKLLKEPQQIELERPPARDGASGRAGLRREGPAQGQIALPAAVLASLAVSGRATKPGGGERHLPVGGGLPAPSGHPLGATAPPGARAHRGRRSGRAPQAPRLCLLGRGAGRPVPGGDRLDARLAMRAPARGRSPDGIRAWPPTRPSTSTCARRPTSPAAGRDPSPTGPRPPLPLRWILRAPWHLRQRRRWARRCPRGGS